MILAGPPPLLAVPAEVASGTFTLMLKKSIVPPQSSSGGRHGRLVSNFETTPHQSPSLSNSKTVISLGLRCVHSEMIALNIASANLYVAGPPHPPHPPQYTPIG